MTAILLTLVLCGQCHSSIGYGPQACWEWDGSVQNHSGWGYSRLYGNGYYPPEVFVPRFSMYPLPSPWNQAVSKARAAHVAKPHRLPTGTLAELQSAMYEKQQLWIELIEAEAADKALARDAYLKAKDRLHRIQVAAARELR